MRNKMYFSGVLIATLLFSTVSAFAAENTEEKPYELETVIVTSQKVETSKQKVSGNVSVYDGTQLQDMQIDRLEDLANIAPNISCVRPDNHTTQFSFRGIGGMANMNKVWNINVDGVAVPYTAIDTLLDVDRVEIMRGSQGSLYGRNTHAGCVNIITRGPSSESEADIAIDYGRFNTFNGSAAFGGPISDMTGYRLVLGYKRSDGYFKNTYLDKDDTNRSEQFTARGKLEFTPENLGKITLGLYADSNNGRFDSYTPRGEKPGRKVENNQPGYNNGYLFSPTLTWEKDFGDMTLTSITNYSRSNYGMLQDWDFTRKDISDGEYDEIFDTFTQEIRLNGGQEDGLQWLVGAFGLIENLETQTDARFHSDAALWGMPVGAHMYQNSTLKTQGAAVFGQGIYRILPSLEVTAALRLDYERKEMDWEDGNNLGGPTGSVHNQDQWFAASPTLSLAYLFSEEKRAYATVSRGFKSGDYNIVMVEMPVVKKGVDPEFVTTYEVGYKGRHFDNHLELNAALFYNDWQDMQVDIAIGSNLFEKQNAAKAHSSGLELEAKARLSKSWTVFAGLGYMFEYEFDEFQSGANNLKGKKLPYTNAYTINAGALYRGSNGLFLGFDVNQRGKQYMDEVNKTKQNDYTLVNAKVGYEQGNWDAYIYGRNLFNTKYAKTSFNQAKTLGEPLTFGAQFNYRF